jgi:hypothetical protein
MTPSRMSTSSGLPKFSKRPINNVQNSSCRGRMMLAIWSPVTLVNTRRHARFPTAFRPLARDIKLFIEIKLFMLHPLPLAEHYWITS